MSQEMSYRDMRQLKVVLALLVMLSLVSGIIGCGSGGEATSPEGKEIERFLDDKHIKAILQEEWDIFSEYNYGYSLYAESGYSSSWYKDYWRNEWEGLIKRAAENYNAIASVSPSVLVTPFWDGIELAMQYLREAMSPSIPYALKDFSLRRAFQKNAQAWLELRNICRQWNLEMPWPLPPQPSWPTPDSQW